MSGEPADLHLFVVVWDGDCIVRVYEWYDWVSIPVTKRPFDNTMLKAKDELDAMLRAARGEEWHTQQSDWMEQEYDTDE